MLGRQFSFSNLDGKFSSNKHDATNELFVAYLQAILRACYVGIGHDLFVYTCISVDILGHRLIECLRYFGT